MTNRLTLADVRELFKVDSPNVQIESLYEQPASGRGDNYTSMLYGVSAKGRQFDKKTQSWQDWQQAIIYKILPESRERREAFKSELLFRNEMAFYLFVWPKLNQLQEKEKVFEGVAKIYAARPDLIAMEDLRVKGFNMADRRKGLEVERLRAVLKALAGFHALSLTLRDVRPDEFERLSTGENGHAIQEALFRIENEDWYRHYYRVAINNALTMVSSQLPDSMETRRDEIMAKLKAFLNEEVFFRTMCELTAAKGPLTVFCHGDCWTNNFLFRKREESELEDVYLVDFQLTRVGSLALDLTNLLYCCTSGQVRKDHMTQLLRHYHSHLMTALRTLNPCGPHKDADLMWNLLNEEIRRCGRFGFGLALDILPISTCASDQAPDLYEGAETNKDGRNVRAPPPGGAECARLMTELVLELVENQAL